MIDQELRISSSRGSYSVMHFLDFSELAAYLSEEDSGNMHYAIDSLVWERYQFPQTLSLERVRLFHVCPRTKQLASVVELLEYWSRRGLKKTDQVVVIGGATLQDLCGTALGLYHRGISWQYIPTTLLAQGDSCIGSKTSIDSYCSKNQYGLFYPPSRIILCPDFLTTLPTAELLSGLGDIMHYTLPYSIELESLCTWLEGCGNISNEVTREFFLELTSKSLAIKGELVEIDEFDRGPRAIFNYGHTFGHVLEKTADSYLPHGIAVLIGILCAEHAAGTGYLSGPKTKLVRYMINAYINSNGHVPVFDASLYEDSFARDKKNRRSGYVRVVVPCEVNKGSWHSTRFKPEFGLCTKELAFRDAAKILTATVEEIGLRIQD